MKKGFVIGGILIAVGLVLQATAGPVCWDSLAYPVNLTGLFTFLTVARMGPSAKTMPPALQSPWFIPHLIVYMAGYAMLATPPAISACTPIDSCF
jgi:ABC-type transport system involved in cytochrome c biogenesis permease subunit